MEIIISNNANKPIYEQITSQIKAMIMSGELQTGEAIPSMRACVRTEQRILSRGTTTACGGASANCRRNWPGQQYPACKIDRVVDFVLPGGRIAWKTF